MGFDARFSKGVLATSAYRLSYIPLRQIIPQIWVIIGCNFRAPYGCDTFRRALRAARCLFGCASEDADHTVLTAAELHS